MYDGRLVFAQLFDFLPMHAFTRCVERYRGHHKVKKFSCQDQFRCMAFAQLANRESLRDIEVCLRAQQSKLYHMGFRSGISRNTLANANSRRDWRIYADFAQHLIALVRPLYADDDFGVDLQQTVYALDSTTIDLCRALFPWARYMATKGAIKLHTQLDLRGPIPSFIYITDGKVNDVRMLDRLVIEPDAFYVFDRGYLDFARLYEIHLKHGCFVTRLRKNIQFRRRYSRPVDSTTGLRSDQTVMLSGQFTPNYYPEALRRVTYRDPESGRTFAYISNNFDLPALTIVELYQRRWQIELFFKWIKQHLRIKAFFGRNENAVRTQIWIAISVYVLVALIRKRLNLDADLYTILQVLSLTLFEKTPLNQLLSDSARVDAIPGYANQLNLFEKTLGH